MESKKQVFLPILIILSLTWITEAGLTKSETTRLCHVCDAETCKTYNVKKATPRKCTVELLKSENGGPTKLSQMSFIEYYPSQLQLDTITQFSCQKVEGTDRNGFINIVRRCQLKMRENAACEVFETNARLDRENTYVNRSCTVCDTDGCNSSGTSHIWISLLFSSCIFSIYNIFNIFNAFV